LLRVAVPWQQLNGFVYPAGFFFPRQFRPPKLRQRLYRIKSKWDYWDVNQDPRFGWFEVYMRELFD
jgi:hypothetical protein